MREKSIKLVITFQLTADAMRFEAVCKKRNAPGRIIPVPREISAGCGMAWRADVTDREVLSRLIQEEGIEIQEIHTCLL